MKFYSSYICLYTYSLMEFAPQDFVCNILENVFLPSGAWYIYVQPLGNFGTQPFHKCSSKSEEEKRNRRERGRGREGKGKERKEKGRIKGRKNI